ncbi:MAG: energy transducer TonB [Chromatiales bacterium]
MSAVLSATAVVAPSDRLALTLCLAILLHAIVILGVSFVPPLPDLPGYETIEIVLVNSRSEEKPKDAQLLAQANQIGGGEEEEDVRPATPMATPVPAAVSAVPMAPTPSLAFDLPAPAPPEVAPDTARPDPATVAREVEQETTVTPELVAQSMAEAEKSIAETPPVTRDVKKEEAATSESTAAAVDREPEMAKAEREATTPPLPPTLSGAALLARSFQIASLDAEIAERMEAKAKRPRRKFISATTAEYKYAAYMEAWRQKVERIGNLNYPDEARRQRLSGSLILDVALNADGSISEITVRRPSGFSVLDDAAIRIVELAAPYAAFPEAFATEVDILHITRTWQFKSGARFASQ